MPRISLNCQTPKKFQFFITIFFFYSILVVVELSSGSVWNERKRKIKSRCTVVHFGLIGWLFLRAMYVHSKDTVAPHSLCTIETIWILHRQLNGWDTTCIRSYWIIANHSIVQFWILISEIVMGFPSSKPNTIKNCDNGYQLKILHDMRYSLFLINDSFALLHRIHFQKRKKTISP